MMGLLKRSMRGKGRATSSVMTTEVWATDLTRGFSLSAALAHAIITQVPHLGFRKIRAHLR